MVSQIHLSVSLPPLWMWRSNWVEIFLIQRCILGPLRYPKNNMVWDIRLFMTLVCLLIPWYMLQLVMNSSTLSQSPMKISGSLPIILSNNVPGSAALAPPAGSGLPPPLPPPLGLCYDLIGLHSYHADTSDCFVSFLFFFHATEAHV